MYKRLFLFAILIGLSLMGCSNERLSGGKPPKVFLEIDHEMFEATLGTYCWNGTCIDTAGPIELLEGKKPIIVKSGETVKLVMDFEPKPNEIHVVEMSENEETEVEVKDNQITAPKEKGIYYYSYGAWWMDEKEENVSNGDAFYAFVLEVN